MNLAGALFIRTAFLTGCLNSRKLSARRVQRLSTLRLLTFDIRQFI